MESTIRLMKKRNEIRIRKGIITRNERRKPRINSKKRIGQIMGGNAMSNRSITMKENTFTRFTLKQTGRTDALGNEATFKTMNAIETSMKGLITRFTNKMQTSTDTSTQITQTFRTKRISLSALKDRQSRRSSGRNTSRGKGISLDCNRRDNR
jgi:hypothetical protein